MFDNISFSIGMVF